MSFLWALYHFFFSPIAALLVFIIVLNAILSWLVLFNVVNPRNQVVATLGQFAQAVTEPLLRPFRRFIPPLGNVDITPILLILTIMFVDQYLLPSILSVIAGPRGF